MDRAGARGAGRGSGARGGHHHGSHHPCRTRKAKPPSWCASPAVIAGLDLAEATFKDARSKRGFTRVAEDGGNVEAGATIAKIEGRTRALLTGERTALNFLGRLCGIATLTAAYVAKVEGTPARIACTRKTTPGLRALEKYAVRCGGGVNHRFGLYDAVLVKDNHIAAAGGLGAALERLRPRASHMVKIEVEVDTLQQLEEALSFPIDAVLLDNMDVETLRKAVALAKGKVLTEASGGVSLETVSEIARTGVDLISVGALTHSPRNLDSSLEWVRPLEPATAVTEPTRSNGTRRRVNGAHRRGRATASGKRSLNSASSSPRRPRPKPRRCKAPRCASCRRYGAPILSILFMQPRPARVHIVRVIEGRISDFGKP